MYLCISNCQSVSHKNKTQEAKRLSRARTMLDHRCFFAEHVVRGESCGISAHADLDILVGGILLPQRAR
jgi:hypothetical protein